MSSSDWIIITIGEIKVMFQTTNQVYNGLLMDYMILYGKINYSDLTRLLWIDLPGSQLAHSTPAR
jgi:hypothetical protein